MSFRPSFNRLNYPDWLIFLQTVLNSVSLPAITPQRRDLRNCSAAMVKEKISRTYLDHTSYQRPLSANQSSENSSRLQMQRLTMRCWLYSQDTQPATDVRICQGAFRSYTGQIRLARFASGSDVTPFYDRPCIGCYPMYRPLGDGRPPRISMQFCAKP